MENHRNLAILRKCVNSASSLQNFVEGLEKNLCKNYSKAKDQSKNQVDGETVDVTDMEISSLTPAVLENVYDAEAEPAFEIEHCDSNIDEKSISEAEGVIVEEEMVEEYLEMEKVVVSNSEEYTTETEGCIVDMEMHEEDLRVGIVDIESAQERTTDVECYEDQENIEAEIMAQIEAEDRDVCLPLETLEAIVDDQEKNVLSKKRARNPKVWERCKSRTNRNMGESYTNVKTGRSFPARSMQPGCNDNCSIKCTMNFTSCEREAVFKKYWQLGDVSKQREFIHNSVKEIKPKYRYTREGSSRKNNLSYYFLKDETQVRVCKKFFCDTLNISAKVIQTAISKFVDNVIQRDLRGTHTNHPSVSPELKEGIKLHINSFQRIESHYLRQQTKREYIDGSLNVSLMYRMYKDQCIKDGVQFAKQSTYEQIFNFSFNIGFFKPKKDQCIQCFQFENSTEAQKMTLRDDHSKHISEKELSRHQKEEDKKKSELNSNIKAVCMDLQAVMPVPCGDVSSFYYKRRLLCFNFTIFELFTNEGFCFLWHEGIAHRGSNEIAACLKIYMMEKCSSVEHLIIWSDNCSGQNKNKFLLCFLMQLVQICNIKSISQKFLVVGHTQNEGDNMHSQIEKNKSRCLKSGPIFTCDQLVPIIQLAKKTKPFYKVHQLQTNEVYDLKDLCSKTGKNFTKSEINEKVVWADIKEFLIEKEKPNVVKYKTSFSDTNFKSFKVCSEAKCLDLKLAYTDGPPMIPSAKKKDLMDLCRQNSITTSHHQFFYNLKAEEEHEKVHTGRKRRAGA